VTHPSAGQQAFRLRLDVKVPMRDGVNLSADVWLPLGDGAWPTLLLRTIYNNQHPRDVAWARQFVEAGYAVVLQDCRGRHDSDGTWAPYLCEATDGYDTHEWIGRQPWCDGHLGTFGISYNGFTQTLPAPLRSRCLKALVPIASQQDNYGHHRVDGVIHHSVSLFFANMMGRTMQTEALAQLDLEAQFRHLPLISSLDCLGPNPYYRGVIEHEQYDEFWSRCSLRHRYGEVDAPALFVTGWYDSLLHETLKVFTGWKREARSAETRRLTKLLIGPWGHQVAPWGHRPLGPNGEFGDVAFGPDAAGNIHAMHLRWYDARLKGIDTGIDDEPPVKLFVMGRNAWRFEPEWPLARARPTDFYLHGAGPADAAGETKGGGTLNTTRPGQERPDQFDYDPADPVPSWGAQYQMMDRTGPRDRREIERRPDVLVYSSNCLEQEIEVTGPVWATLYASSTARDTDFTAALVDLFPDGRAIILCEGICRARFRGGTDRPAPIEPGRIYEYRIDLWETSNVFRKGHRIRLEVSSSNFPRYNRNLNTGSPIATDTEMRVAHQTVYHDAGHPSRVTLPLVPDGSREAARLA
jgi:putative CocE/NonD family hydrolase